MTGLLSRIFKPAEVKVMEREFDRLFAEIRKDVTFLYDQRIEDDIRRNLLRNHEATIKSLRESGKSPRTLALYALINSSHWWIGSGHLHVYRGLLGISGKESLKMFVWAVRRLESIGDYTKDECDAMLAEMHEQIREMG